MPLNTKIGGSIKYAKDNETMCLTKDQARHIYRNVKLECVVNVDTNKQEIEDDKLGERQVLEIDFEYN